MNPENCMKPKLFSDIGDCVSQPCFSFNLPHLYLAPNAIGDDAIGILRRFLIFENYTSWAIARHCLHDLTFSHFGKHRFGTDGQTYGPIRDHSIHEASMASDDKNRVSWDSYKRFWIGEHFVDDDNYDDDVQGMSKEWNSLTALVTHHTVMRELLPCLLVLPTDSARRQVQPQS